MNRAPIEEAFGILANKLADTHGLYVETMAAAFLKLTDIPIDQVVLCEQMGPDMVYRYWFERKA